MVFYSVVGEPQKVLERIGNPPAGEEVDRDVELVLGWHIGRIAVPFENSLVDQVDVLDEGYLDLQTGSSDRSADRLAELGDNRLLDFAHCINRTHQNVRSDAQNHQDSWLRDPIHGRSPFWESRFSNSRMLRVCSSTMILERMPGITSSMVSMSLRRPATSGGRM